MCCSFTWVLINIDLAVIVGLQGPHISITSNYTHTHPHTNTLFNCKFYSWVWVSALAHKLQQQTDTINKYRCCSAWLNYCEMKGAYKYWETFPLNLSSVFSFLPPFLLDSWSHPHPPLSPPFCLHFVSAVDSASITAKSNLSNHNLAGPSTPCWCLFVWSPTNEMCDKATEGVQLGIKTDFCTLKSEQIKNNRALFVVQRERFSPSSILPHSCTFSSQPVCHSVNCHISHTGPQPASPSCSMYLPQGRHLTPCAHIYASLEGLWQAVQFAQSLRSYSICCLSSCLLISGSHAFTCVSQGLLFPIILAHTGSFLSLTLLLGKDAVAVIANVRGEPYV